MGKTAQGAVWLNPEPLPDFYYWQYWRNVDDADVGRFLRLFTDLPVSEIETWRLEGADLNEAKKKLAFEATDFVAARPLRWPPPGPRTSCSSGTGLGLRR